jgi:hypothetical protein
VLFPVAFPVSIAIFTRRNGAIIRARTGTSIARQIVEQAWLGLVHSVVPYWYYVFELHEAAPRREAALYLQRYETKELIFGMLQPAVDDGMQDKLLFSTACLAKGVCTVPVLFDLTGGVASVPGGSSSRAWAAAVAMPSAGTGAAVPRTGARRARCSPSRP